MEERKYRDKDWLKKQYADKELSTVEIAEKTSVTSGTINHWLEKFNIERRSISEAFGNEYDNIFIVLCKGCHGNSSSWWHNSTVGEQIAKIGGEPAGMI